MLTPTQVLPFLTHADEPVRDLAERYLTDAHDASPVTADDVWRAVDALTSAKARRRLIRGLPHLPQTDASVQRLLAELGDTRPGRDRDELERAVAWLDGSTLRKHRDAIVDHLALSRDVRRELRRRVELSDLPADAAWDRLMALSGEVADKARSQFDGPTYQGLLDAAERQPELAERAMALLADETVTDWREVFAVDVLGRLRHAPAIGAVVAKLATDDEADALASSAVDALVRIGSADAVTSVADALPAMPWGARLSATDVLRRVKRPESEAAAVRLLGTETDQTVRTNLAMALCELGTTDPRAYELMRTMVEGESFDLAMVDLEEVVLAAATMAGVDVPEAAGWRDRLGDKSGRRQQRIDAMRRMMGERTDDLLLEPSDLIAPIGGTMSPPAPPVHRDAPKAGRNDPCPCGSGKKYKKCCAK
jgi:HEAT repeat protein